MSNQAFQLLVDDKIRAPLASDQSAGQLSSNGGTFAFSSAWKETVPGKRSDFEDTMPCYDGASMKLGNDTENDVYFTFIGTSLDLYGSWSCPSDPCSFSYTISTEGQAQNQTGKVDLTQTNTTSILSLASDQLSEAKHTVHLSNFTGLQASQEIDTTWPNTQLSELALHYAVITPGKESRFPNGTVYVGLDSPYVKTRGTWKTTDGQGVSDAMIETDWTTHDKTDSVSMVYPGAPLNLRVITRISNSSESNHPSSTPFGLKLQPLSPSDSSSLIIDYGFQYLASNPLSTSSGVTDDSIASDSVNVATATLDTPKTSDAEQRNDNLRSYTMGFVAFTYDLGGKSFSSLDDMPSFGWEDAPSQAGSDSDSNGSNKGKIAGGVVGGVVGILLLGALAWFLMKRKRRTVDGRRKKYLYDDDYST